MKKLSLISFYLSFLAISTSVYAESTSVAAKTEAAAKQAIQPFTGKIMRNKVRLRLQPNLESGIAKELHQGDMLIVVDEADDFFVVLPPKDIKGYVYRTFVLDNKIEGSHVNVRVEPHTEAPVIAQLNTGDSAQGIISSVNPKWLEIAPPASARLYVSKEYIEKVGDATYLAKLAKREKNVKELLASAIDASQKQLELPFTHISQEDTIAQFQKVIKLYSDFPDQVKVAKEQMAKFQEAYIEKKIAYLETKMQVACLESRMQPANEVTAQGHEPFLQTVVTEQIATASADSHQPLDLKPRSHWLDQEEFIYTAWINQNGTGSPEDFYKQQELQGMIVTGIIETYDRPVKNKPGDYVLVHPTTRLPIAYLYSTRVDLKNKVGRAASVVVSPRPNHYFAYPAYYVLGLE